LYHTEIMTDVRRRADIQGGRGDRSIWATWLAVTAVYLLTYVVGFMNVRAFSSDYSGDVAGRVAAIVGLFVPFGIWNTLALVAGPVSFLSMPVAIGLMAVYEHYARPLNIAGVTKISLNLMVLLVVTFVVDLMIYHGWVSFQILYGGKLVPFF